MTIRIQPRDIDVPADDPFEDDLLGREGVDQSPDHRHQFA